MRLPASVELGNRITAAEAANRYKLPNGYKTLCQAIAAGIVRGERVDVGRRSIHLVDAAELEEDLANLPECGYPGCSRKALAPSGACSGPHARALETKGTKLSAETCRRMSEGKKGKPRPDMVGKMPGHFGADPEERYRWNVAVVKGRERISTPEAAARMRLRATRRLTGTLGARGSTRTGAPTVEARLSRTEEGRAKLAEFRRLREKHPQWGRPALVEGSGLKDSQVRALMD